MHRALIVIVGFAAALCVACAPKPRSVTFAEALPLTVVDPNPVSLPAAVVTGTDGNRISAAVDVTVDPPGYARIADGNLTAFQSGQVKIVLAVKDSNVRAEFPLTIALPTPVNLSCPKGCQMTVGSEVHLRSSVVSGTRVLEELEPSNFTSSAEGVASVDSKGTVTAHRSGHAQITATSGVFKASVDVEVLAFADKLEIFCPTFVTEEPLEGGGFISQCRMVRGSSNQFHARASVGDQPAMHEHVSFESLNDHIVEVSTTGSAHAINVGTTAVRARVEDRLSAQMAVDVEEPIFKSFLRGAICTRDRYPIPVRYPIVDEASGRVVKTIQGRCQSGASLSCLAQVIHMRALDQARLEYALQDLSRVCCCAFQ